MNIIEQNLLINKFIYGDKCEFNGNQYHTSWSELMYAVEKIEKLFNNGFDVDIFSDGTVITQYKNSLNIYLKEPKEIVRLTRSEIGFDSKIEHTHMAVLDFIKFWNN